MSNKTSQVKKLGRPLKEDSQAWILQNQPANTQLANNKLKPDATIKILGVSNSSIEKRKVTNGKSLMKYYLKFVY